ncbi:MAG: hypothetical protein LBI53_05615 [Candidatus Peribacteria bacterium]|nr:hypothetical protein [Candidatus Peribacteria bacterium]
MGIILSIFAIILSPIAGQYLARVGSKPERLKGEKEKAFERDFKYNKKTRQFIIDGNEVVIDDGKDH